MFLHVDSVRYLGGYRLRLQFSDGSAREVDLAGELYGEVFEPLRDVTVFRQVRLNRDTNTIEWPTGADFAPEFLHEVGIEVARAA